MTAYKIAVEKPNSTHDLTIGGYWVDSVNKILYICYGSPTDGITPTGTIVIKENGTYNIEKYKYATIDTNATATGAIALSANGNYDITQYAEAIVNVETGIVPSGNIEITKNGNYDISEYAAVSVNIPGPSSTQLSVLPIPLNTQISFKIASIEMVS